MSYLFIFKITRHTKIIVKLVFSVIQGNITEATIMTREITRRKDTSDNQVSSVLFRFFVFLYLLIRFHTYFSLIWFGATTAMRIGTRFFFFFMTLTILTTFTFFDWNKGDGSNYCFVGWRKIGWRKKWKHISDVIILFENGFKQPYQKPFILLHLTSNKSFQCFYFDKMSQIILFLKMQRCRTARTNASQALPRLL